MSIAYGSFSSWIYFLKDSRLFGVFKTSNYSPKLSSLNRVTSWLGKQPSGLASWNTELWEILSKIFGGFLCACWINFGLVRLKFHLEEKHHVIRFYQEPYFIHIYTHGGFCVYKSLEYKNTRQNLYTHFYLSYYVHAGDFSNGCLIVFDSTAANCKVLLRNGIWRIPILRNWCSPI